MAAAAAAATQVHSERSSKMMTDNKLKWSSPTHFVQYLLPSCENSKSLFCLWLIFRTQLNDSKLIDHFGMSIVPGKNFWGSKSTETYRTRFNLQQAKHLQYLLCNKN
jgi:hypothetical protein